jgi:DNA (cytosine-5)-methyltransferase 1
VYTVGELFAGIGGIGLGFQNAGFKVVWANEIDKNACVTYSRNFNCRIINKDMQEINHPRRELEEADIITGGFPCQPFSIAGSRRGFKDDRGSLFFDILRFIKALKPRVVFLENVKNLVSHNGGRTFETILDRLEQLGYFVKHALLNTAQYSQIPQNRERIYIVCFKNKDDFSGFEFPHKTVKTRTVSDFLEKETGSEFYYNNSKYYPKLKAEITKRNTIYQLRRVYVRENKSSLCPALTANMGTGGHNVPLIKDGRGIRKLTPRECASFQGFPVSFKLPSSIPRSALYKQTGNSVSVPVITAVAKNIKKALEEGSKQKCFLKTNLKQKKNNIKIY